MIVRISFCLFLGFLLTDSAFAQLASQTALVGTVSDTGGLPVPGAQVVAVNVGTKDTYETVTNAEGYYNVQFVRIGAYEITISLAGFQTFKATGIQVATNQVVRTNAVLQVGAVTESVNVTAAAILLSTDSATVSETISERAVVDLPVSGSARGTTSAPRRFTPWHPERTPRAAADRPRPVGPGLREDGCPKPSGPRSLLRRRRVVHSDERSQPGVRVSGDLPKEERLFRRAAGTVRAASGSDRHGGPGHHSEGDHVENRHSHGRSAMADRGGRDGDDRSLCVGDDCNGRTTGQ